MPEANPRDRNGRMLPHCPVREDDPIGWVCYRQEGHAGRHGPIPSKEAKAFLLHESDSLDDALFGLADLFRVSLTNNGTSWIEDDGTPVYTMEDFLDVTHEIIRKFGHQVEKREDDADV